MSSRPLTADERADDAVTVARTMPRSEAASYLERIAGALDSEGEHAACARCHEEIRRRAVPVMAVSTTWTDGEGA